VISRTKGSTTIQLSVSLSSFLFIVLRRSLFFHFFLLYITSLSTQNYLQAAFYTTPSMLFLKEILIVGALLGSGVVGQGPFEFLGPRSCFSTKDKLPSDPSRKARFFSASSRLSTLCNSPAQLNLKAGPTDPIFKKTFEGITFDIIRYPPTSTAGDKLNISKAVCEAGFGNVLTLCFMHDSRPSGFVYAGRHQMEFRIYNSEHMPEEVVKENSWRPRSPQPLLAPTSIVRPNIPGFDATNCLNSYNGPLDFLDQNSQERGSINTTVSNYCETMGGQVQIGKKNVFLRWASAIGWV